MVEEEGGIMFEDDTLVVKHSAESRPIEYKNIATHAW